MYFNLFVCYVLLANYIFANFFIVNTPLNKPEAVAAINPSILK